MRRAIACFAGLSAAFVLSATAALADQYKLTLPANRSSQIAFFSPYAENTCAAVAKPKLEVTRQPAHGTLKLVWKQQKVKDLPSYCPDKPRWGTAVIYTPRGGYRGKDSFSFGGYFAYWVEEAANVYYQYDVEATVK